MYQLAVVLVVALHLTFLGYLAVGGFLALHFPHTFWLHLPTVAWGVAIGAEHLDCPLTWLERRARARAGWAPLPPDGFIAHYLTGVVYPASAANLVKVAVLVTVLVSWGCCGRDTLRRRRYGGRHAGPDHRRRPERLL